MKKHLIVIAAVAMFAPSLVLNAQNEKYGPNAAECLKYLSYYEEYYKQKNYADATPNWRQAYKYCPPESRQKMLVDGTTLMRKLITANSKNPIYKQALIDSLMTLHDQRANFFPKSAVTARNNKGLDLANYIKDDDARLFREYNEIIEQNESETKPSIYLFDLKAAIDLYKDGLLNEEDVIETYNRNVDFLSQAEPKNQADAEQIEKVKVDIESLFVSSKVASCDKLIALFTPRFEAAPSDVALSQKIVSFMLKTEDCADNDLITKAMAVVYKNNPTASSAYVAYQISVQANKIKDAVSYLEEAIRLSEEKDAAQYSFELATLYYKLGNNVKCVEAAKSAVAKDVNKEFTGRAYFLIANVFSAAKCGGNDIENRAPFWVAVDYLNKAKAADPSLAAEANKKIAEFSVFFPSTADAFMYDLQDGASYEVNCAGLHATTTVRTQK